MTVVKAVCVLSSLSVRGVITFEQSIDDLLSTRVYGFISGLKKGLHGFHIHTYGDLSKGCESAGPHFNPFNKNHGDVNVEENHVGDLGNIYSKGEDEPVMIDMIVNNLSLIGKYSVIGRALIVHEDEDDLGKTNHPLSKTTGNSGARIACGVIGISSSN